MSTAGLLSRIEALEAAHGSERAFVVLRWAVDSASGVGAFRVAAPDSDCREWVRAADESNADFCARIESDVAARTVIFIGGASGCERDQVRSYGSGADVRIEIPDNGRDRLDDPPAPMPEAAPAPPTPSRSAPSPPPASPVAPPPRPGPPVQAQPRRDYASGGRQRAASWHSGYGLPEALFPQGRF